jgi:hypothetical protein
MKKIITVLIAVAAFASVHAQSSKEEARKVVLGQPKQTTSQQQSRNVILGRNPQQSGRVYKTDRNGEHRYGKTNNGKHLGWYKGKGNPHKYGVKPGKGNKGGHGKHND